jgi:hypothetical protein
MGRADGRGRFRARSLVCTGDRVELIRTDNPRSAARRHTQDTEDLEGGFDGQDASCAIPFPAGSCAYANEEDAGLRVVNSRSLPPRHPFC